MQDNTPNPRQVLAQELEHWWKSGKHDFRRRHDLARLIGPNGDGMLSSYFTGSRFPTVPICSKLFAVTKLPILEPRKAAETIRQLHSERGRKSNTPAASRKRSATRKRMWKKSPWSMEHLRTPEIAARISAGQIANWAANPDRPIAHLHTPKIKAKAHKSLRKLETRRQISESSKETWAKHPERRKRSSQRQKQVWADLKAELADLRSKAASKPKPFEIGAKVEAVLPRFQEVCTRLRLQPKQAVQLPGYSETEIKAASMGLFNGLRAARWFVSLDTQYTYDTVAQYHKEFRAAQQHP
jgi:hypothetical protein